MRVKNIISDRGILVVTGYNDTTQTIPLHDRDKLLAFMRRNASNVPLFPMKVIDDLADVATYKIQLKMQPKRLLDDWPYFVFDVNFRYSKSYDISFEEPFFKISAPFDDGSDFFRLEYDEIESDFSPNGRYRGAHARRYRIDGIAENLQFLSQSHPNLTIEAVIQTTAGEIYTSEKIKISEIF